MRTPDTIFFPWKRYAYRIVIFVTRVGLPRQNHASARVAGRQINFIVQSRCFRLSGAIDRAGRARDAPFARTVTLICNTCGSSKLPMRKDEWCVRMRLRPDCGGISQVEREREREGRILARSRPAVQRFAIDRRGCIAAWHLINAL